MNRPKLGKNSKILLINYQLVKIRTDIAELQRKERELLEARELFSFEKAKIIVKPPELQPPKAKIMDLRKKPLVDSSLNYPGTPPKYDPCNSCHDINNHMVHVFECGERLCEYCLDHSISTCFSCGLVHTAS